MLTLTLLIISLFAFGQVGSALGMGSGAESLQSWQVGAALGTTSIPESPTSWQICSKSETTSGPESLTSWQVGSESGLAPGSETHSSGQVGFVRDSVSRAKMPISWREHSPQMFGKIYPLESKYCNTEKRPIMLGSVHSLPQIVKLYGGYGQHDILSSSVLTRPV
jgi:hypothetical protein